MGFFSTIGSGIDYVCGLVWRGLKAIWSVIKKIVSVLIDWTVSIVKWLTKAAAKVAGAIIAAVVVFFIWIFGDDGNGGIDPPTGGETNLGEEIKNKLGGDHKVIVVKGVFNKDTNSLEGETEIERSNKISSEVKQQTGGNRFAELQVE